MSIPAVHWALSQKTGSSSRKSVLKSLAAWMIGDYAVDCYPTIEQIAFETELNRQTVMDATRDLEKAGIIKKRRICKNLRWETHYSFVGYVPDEWIGSRRPEVVKSGNSNVRNIEGTENRTYGNQYPERTKNQTIEGTGNHTSEGMENRTRTRIDKEDKESTRISMRPSAPSSATASAPASQAQPPEMSDEELESLFADAQIELGSKPNDAPKRKAPAAPRKKPATRCPFDAEALIPDDYRQIADKAGIGDPQSVFTAFVNYCLANDKRYVIWPSAFRTWCSNETRYRPNQKPRVKPLSERTAADYVW